MARRPALGLRRHLQETQENSPGNLLRPPEGDCQRKHQANPNLVRNEFDTEVLV